MVNPIKNKTAEMPFWDHVDELRNRFIKSLFFIILFTILAYIFSDRILLILSELNTKSIDNINLQVLKITSMFMIKVYVSLVVGIILSMPIILYQFWRFVSPAISSGFGFYTFFLFTLSSIFFFLGSYFSYLVIIPVSIDFFTSMTSDHIPVNYNFTLENYLLYIIWMIMVGGLIFQLPILSIIFNKLGLINYKTLVEARRFSILGIFIISAILTPPDPFSQIMFVVPLIILYEISILILRFLR